MSSDGTSDSALMYLGQDRVFEPLRKDPRFIELMKKAHCDK